MSKEHPVEIVTFLENGSKIKFLMKYDDFIISLKNDRKLGMKMWLEDNISRPYDTTYKIKSLTYGEVSGNLVKVELEMNKYSNSAIKEI